MRGFRKLVLLGVLLATLLNIIGTIDAKKKDYKKNEVEGKSGQEYGSKKDGQFGKVKKSESFKSEKYKKSNSVKEENISGNKQYFTEDSKIETKNYKVKRGTKYTKKDSETIEEGVNPKITKTFQKVKKYKIVEDSPTENHFSSKTKAKKTKSKVEKEETVNEVFQTVKKAQKKGKENDKLEDILQEEILSQFSSNGENVILEEASGSNPRRKKYKLVEVVLEEDGEEDKEINETIIVSETEEGDEEMGGIHRTEREEVIEKFKTTHSVKLPKLNKKSSKKDMAQANEEQIDEKCPIKSEIASDSEVERGPLSDKFESESSIYEEPEVYESCEPASDDPNRTGPKKLTLYVIEEEVDGKITKRIVSEEDGVNMCEVADLLRDHYYYEGLP